LVRIEARIVESLFQLGFKLRSQEVLHLFGRLVHVVWSYVHGLVEIKFPKPVETDDAHGV
jgi:hypothetical protein